MCRQISKPNDGKVKVAIVMHGLQAGGIDKLFADLTHSFDMERVSITYLLAVDKNATQLFEGDVIGDGAEVIHLHDLRKKQLAKWPITMYGALQEYGPFDVVHSNMDVQDGLILKIAKFVGVPARISHAHVPSHKKDHQSMLRRPYLKIMRQWIHRNATMRIACSEEAGRYFYREDPFIILPNGIDLSKFRDARLAHKSNRSSAYRVITIGRMCQEKNPLFILDVFEEIHQQKPEATLTWIGDGIMRDTVVKRVQEKQLTDCVRLMGKQKHVEAFLEGADIFLFPSLYEGFGIAALEAQAAGLECYVSDSVPKMVDCGKCHFLSLDLSAREWAEHIIADVEAGTKTELDEEKLRQFDIRTMAARLTELYTNGAISTEANNVGKTE